MNRSLIGAACATTLALSACSQPATDQPTQVVVAESMIEVDQPAPLEVAPSGAGSESEFDQRGFAGTFTGTLPCADCPGMEVTLTLEPDGTYRVTHVYQERPDGTWSIDGHWSAEADNKVIRLDPNGKTDEDQLYSIASPNRIVMLDGDGNTIDSGMDYGLSRQPSP